MSLPGTIATQGTSAFALWRGELVETVKLAWPIALTQLGQIAMMTTDLILIGRLGDASLAAAALAHTVLFIAFTIGVGEITPSARRLIEIYSAVGA